MSDSQKFTHVILKHIGDSQKLWLPMLCWRLAAVPSLDPPHQHIFYTSFIGHQVLVVYSPSLDPPHQHIFYTSFTNHQVMVFFWPSLDPLDQVVLIFPSLSFAPLNRDSSLPHPLNSASIVFLDEFRSFWLCFWCLLS
jgi:hypothetical protein